MATTEGDPGVVEAVVSLDEGDTFSEDLVNEVIKTLQAQEQITPKTHTIILHTPDGGPTLNVVSNTSNIIMLRNTMRYYDN